LRAEATGRQPGRPGTRPPSAGPYESPLEVAFSKCAQRYFSPDVPVFAQVPVSTAWGRFRLDFAAQQSGKTIGFECDGSQYHDEHRDEWRDAIVLGSGLVDAIYRLRGKDLRRHLEDCLYLISRWDSGLFDETAIQGLEEVATGAVQSWEEPAPYLRVARYSVGADGREESIQVVRRSLANESVRWKFEFALAHGGYDPRVIVHAHERLAKPFDPLAEPLRQERLAEARQLATLGQGWRISGPCRQNPGRRAPLPGVDRTSTSRWSVLCVIKEVVESVDRRARAHPGAFRHAIETRLEELGWEFTRNFPVRHGPEGHLTYVNLVVTAPRWMAIEIDRVSPRKRSIQALLTYRWLRIVILRQGRRPGSVIPGIDAIIC
jgi:hypothetical protein